MKDIPIFINNKENLTDTKGLVGDLIERGYSNIHILDNDSDYPPLLEWYNNCPATVHRYPNHGDKCFWNSKICDQYKDHKYLVLSTSDIRLNPKTPDDFIEKMIEKLEKYPQFDKIGLSLALDFERNTEYQEWSYNWEQQFWKNEIEPNLYNAHVDTTFNVFKPGPHSYNGMRIAGDFTARHMTWYIDFNKELPEQEQYYLNKATDESFYKRYYLRFLEAKKQSNV